MDKTTIVVSKVNHEKLKKISEINKMTMDQIIEILLDHYTKKDNKLEIDYDDQILGIGKE